MFTQEQHDKLKAISKQEELIPMRLRNHDLLLIAQVLENGRSQRFFNADPVKELAGVAHEELVNTVRELRWEGYVDIESDDVDNDGILDDIAETGWKTNDSGIEFLRRLKQAAGID